MTLIFFSREPAFGTYCQIKIVLNLLYGTASSESHKNHF
jgi:hypothetical protein